VREDTRFLAQHAEALPIEEMVQGQAPDHSLTDHKRSSS
jgi:F-type H+-transporting ATPase subunit epsilon